VDRVYRLVIGFPLEPSADPLDDSNANEAWSLVGDENIADIRSAIHWGAVESEILRFQYSVAAQEQLVRNAILGSMREVLGGASINTAFTADRWGHEQDIERLAQQRLDIYGSGIRIHSFHILDAHAPPRVHAAFRDVASAMEDRATKIDEARAEEARIVPQARGEAAQQIAEAHGYADETVRLAKGEADRFLSVLGVYCASPEVTGLRLELETLEQVLPKLRKYLKPPDAQAGELEIWFVGPDAAEELAR
jgi:membrane protease subunit HflK